MQIGNDEMDSYTRDEESAVSDEEAQREPNINVVNIDKIWTLHDRASEQSSGSSKTTKN